MPWHIKGNQAYNRSVDALNEMYKNANENDELKKEIFKRSSRFDGIVGWR